MMAEAGGDTGFVEAQAMLHAFAQTLAQAQRDMDRNALELARQFIDLDDIGFSLETNTLTRIPAGEKGNASVLPLSSLIPHRHYQLAEMHIEFAVIPKKNLPPGSFTGKTRFRIVPRDFADMQKQPAFIKVTQEEHITAVIEIAGVAVKTLVLARDSQVVHTIHAE